MKGKGIMSRRILSSPDGDTFRILVATDNHLGYNENDTIRKNDSFRTFDEIFEIALQNEVDLVLLGGDLFHENKPSRLCLHRTVEIFRKHCFGDRPVRFEVVSDQSINFPSTERVNYEDPNYNIALPVFTIHGNHDDPAGVGGYSAVDLLNSCNLLNYFGKAETVDDIQNFPILLRKGSTRLALYGMGNVRDERLHRTFQQGAVKWVRPAEERDQWFNLCVLHQNRTKHGGGAKDYIPEGVLPSFFDIVFWAHEHECIISPERSETGDFYITQPGSSIATSLSQGESREKKIGILEVKGAHYRMIPVPLQTVRPFVMDDIRLADHLDPLDCPMDEVEELLAEKVEEMIQTVDAPGPDASEEEKNMKLPMIRLRVDYTNFDKIHAPRFGQQFVGRVANPEDVLLLKRQASRKAGGVGTGQDEENKEDLDWLLASDVDATPPIHDLVRGILKESGNGLSILSCTQLSEAVHTFVEKKDKDCIGDFVAEALKNMQLGLQSDVAQNQEDIEVLVHRRTQKTVEEEEKQLARKEAENKKMKELEEKQEAIKRARRAEADKAAKSNRKGRSESHSDILDVENSGSDNDDDDLSFAASSRRGNGNGNGSGSRRKSRSDVNAKTKAKSTNLSFDDLDAPPPRRSRPTRAAAARSKAKNDTGAQSSRKKRAIRNAHVISDDSGSEYEYEQEDVSSDCLSDSPAKAPPKRRRVQALASQGKAKGKAKAAPKRKTVNASQSQASQRSTLKRQRAGALKMSQASSRDHDEEEEETPIIKQQNDWGGLNTTAAARPRRSRKRAQK